jgi:heparanase 1
MRKDARSALIVALATLVHAGVAFPSRATAQPLSLAPSDMPRVGTVDERFNSYNVEMAEVIGGTFWKPYKEQGKAARNQTVATRALSGAGLGAGQDPAMFEARPPIDLTKARLAKLTAALGPAYMRVSGTWANTVYFHDSDTFAPNPPNGFQGVLTRLQWRRVIEFARAVNAKLITSFAISTGVRDAAGVWTPDQARKLITYTKTIGGDIGAAEFFNEPTMPE